MNPASESSPVSLLAGTAGRPQHATTAARTPGQPVQAGKHPAIPQAPPLLRPGGAFSCSHLGRCCRGRSRTTRQGQRPARGRRCTGRSRRAGAPDASAVWARVINSDLWTATFSSSPLCWPLTAPRPGSAAKTGRRCPAPGTWRYPVWRGASDSPCRNGWIADDPAAHPPSTAPSPAPLRRASPGGAQPSRPLASGAGQGPFHCGRRRSRVWSRRPRVRVSGAS